MTSPIFSPKNPQGKVAPVADEDSAIYGSGPFLNIVIHGSFGQHEMYQGNWSFFFRSYDKMRGLLEFPVPVSPIS